MRAAIVIGVNKTTSLNELTGAVSDANRFATWITKQGFVTTKFVDEGGQAVTFSAIFDKINSIVKTRQCTQLLVYFAGHGFQSGSSEIWLLSGAPGNAREAIGLEASIMAARESGLASVVFVSDACRSIPTTLQDNRIDGGSIFPNELLNRENRPEVDRFFATLPSLVAVASKDANDSARRNGVFTTELLRAYRNTPVRFVLKLTDGGATVEVVTNRNLKKLLQVPVEDAAYSVAPKAGQLPDAIIESDNAYIGRVERITSRVVGAAPTPEAPSPASPPSVPDLARGLISAAAGLFDPTVPAPALNAEEEAIDRTIGLSAAIDRYAGPAPVDRYESRTGLSVTGTSVVDVCSQSFRVELLGGGSVRLWPLSPAHEAGSVLIRFGDGTGTIVPGLQDYIVHIFVENVVITNINFLPSANSSRWQELQPDITRLERLRATVAAAAGLGVFRIDRKNAASFASAIRVMKSVDPTLGIYAAYAYASAGLHDDVASVQQIMRMELHGDLFDVAMLSRRHVKADEGESQFVVPTCPMLRQGWSLIDVQEARLSGLMREARQWLRPGVWTMFGAEGMDLLFAACKKGKLR